MHENWATNYNDNRVVPFQEQFVLAFLSDKIKIKTLLLKLRWKKMGVKYIEPFGFGERKKRTWGS